VWPRLRFSSLAEYVDAVRPLVDQLPVLRGDGGSYWEDGIGAAAAAAAAHRGAQVLLPAAEALSALVAAAGDVLEPDVASLDAAWARALLARAHLDLGPRTSRPHSAQTRDQLAWKLGQWGRRAAPHRTWPRPP
jgi:NAD(P)-dependent dehydrogenase (short-subunit alcohol dehydrogenase family)